MNDAMVVTFPMALSMVAEPEESRAGALAKRAEVAMLTLQVRAAEREADDAEAALAAFDPEVAGSQVGELLDPLVVRRRRELDVEFNAVRRAAASEIAAAHQQVAELFAAEPQVMAASTASAPETVSPVPPDHASPGGPAPSMAVVPAGVGFDSEGFARAFAASFAEVLDARAPVWNAAAGRRPRFWAHAKHIDVLLIIAATAIAGVVLAAWLV